MPIRTEPLQVEQPVRLPGDFLGVRRLSDWSGGNDQRRLERYYGQANVPPMFWDSQNLNVWDQPGRCYLVKRWNAIEAAQYAVDEEHLLYPFNTALYKCWTAGADPGAALRIEKITSASGTPTWGPITNNYPGATPIKNVVQWRDQFVVASGENLLRVMATAETWSTIGAPAAVVDVATCVGIGPDDRLLAHWQNQGLYAYDGTTWNKVFPTAAANTSAAPDCDAIIRGAGSTHFFTRDSSGITTWYEYFIEPTGTGFRVWLREEGFRVWPQCGDVYDDATYIVGRLGAAGNVGVLMRKEYLAPPVPIAYFDTNLATDGLENQDWSARCVRAVGDALWIGSSSREDRDATVYRYFVDESGQVLMPAATIDGVGGPVYSIGFLPYAATGASTTERMHVAVPKRTYYKDRDGDSDPTTDAATGFIQFPDIDYGVDEKEKLGRIVYAYLPIWGTGSTFEVQYRVDPQKESDPWRVLGQATAQGLFGKAFPNDNARQRRWGLRFRRFQMRAVFTKATAGSLRTTLDTIWIDTAAILREAA